MIHSSDIKLYYSAHAIENPVNITLTEKQLVAGQRLDHMSSEQNFRHFRNKLNKRVYGNASTRHGKTLKMFVVRESDAVHRHHIHCVIGRPEHMTIEEFMTEVWACWTSTRFGHKQLHYEAPETEERVQGWISYCLKARTKDDYSTSIDWINSTCFETC